MMNLLLPQDVSLKLYWPHHGNRGEPSLSTSQYSSRRRKHSAKRTLSAIKTLSTIATTWPRHRFTEAEGALTRVLKLQTKLLGLSHQDTITTLSELTTLKYHQGHLEEEETIGRQALVLRGVFIGVFHPRTISSMIGLAFTLHDRGKWDEAEKW